MQVTPSNLFLLLFWIMWAGFLIIPLFWLLLSIFTPKIILQKFFKEPYFTFTETYILKDFPGFLFRTLIFGWIITFPSLDKKRKLDNLSTISPKWYYFSLRILIISSQSVLFLIVLLLTSIWLTSYCYQSNDILFSIN